jgi:uncharacterized protein (TIGR02172 family)
MKKIGSGRTAEVFLIKEHKVLKLYYDFIPKSIVEKEFYVSQVLSSYHFDVPKVYELVDHNERFGIISEFIDGHSLMTKMGQKPLHVKLLAKRFALVHHRIHQDIDINLPNQKEVLLDRLTRVTELGDPIKDAIRLLINQMTDEHFVCHGDYHPDNVLVMENRDVVIDWLTATIGDPLSDVARTALMFELATIPDEKSWKDKLVLSLLRKIFLRVYLKTYNKVSPIDRNRFEKWKIIMAATRLIEDLPKEEKNRLVKFVSDYFIK